MDAKDQNPEDGEAQPKRRRPKKLIPDPLVCARYGICPMTLYRWDADPSLGFPRPLRIRKRKYRDEDELDAFDERQRMVAPRVL
jgi:hypothetical protein